jgi:hypothetical protein
MRQISSNLLNKLSCALIQAFDCKFKPNMALSLFQSESTFCQMALTAIFWQKVDSLWKRLNAIFGLNLQSKAWINAHESLFNRLELIWRINVKFSYWQSFWSSDVFSRFYKKYRGFPRLTSSKIIILEKNKEKLYSFGLH